MWKFLDTGFGTAEENMKIDADLLSQLKPTDDPTLHFYDWKQKSATYGYFIPVERYLDLNFAKKWDLDLARRPTGGGVVFHISDLAFSVLIPELHEGYFQNTLDNYNFINNRVLKGVEFFFQTPVFPQLLPEEPEPLDPSSAHFCMAKPTKYDVMLRGKKIAGAAQRRRKWGYLHQGSIAIALPPEEMLYELLLPGTKVLEAMKKTTYSILGMNWTKPELIDVRLALKESLKKSFLDG